MKTLTYNNEVYWQVTEVSAVRPDRKDRIKVWTIDKTGTVKCVSRTVMPEIRKVIADQFGGIA